MIEAQHDETEAPDALQKMRAKLRANGIIAPKAERKAREKKVRGAVDGRSLRTKGRTAQLNVRIRPEAKEMLSGVSRKRRRWVCLTGSKTSLHRWPEKRR